MEFPSRKDLNKSNNYKDNIVQDLEKFAEDVDLDNYKESIESTKIDITEKQREFVWIRIYLDEEKKGYERGDKIKMKYVPTDEEIELHFGAYEKVGLHRDFDSSVTNYTSEDDYKTLCCMIDIDRINKNSSDIPKLRTFFTSSRYYEDNLFFKRELEVRSEKEKLNYTSISF